MTASLKVEYLLATLLFWAWQQINESVVWVWDLIIPEFPILRFGAGVMIFFFVFIFGPLLVFVGTDVADDDDDIENQITGNETIADGAETTGGEENETQSPANSTRFVGTNNLGYTYAIGDIKLPSKDPYLCD